MKGKNRRVEKKFSKSVPKNYKIFGKFPHMDKVKDGAEMNNFMLLPNIQYIKFKKGHDENCI